MKRLLKHRGEYLVVILDTSLSLGMLESSLPVRFRTTDGVYVDEERNDFTGVYGWLRGTDGRLKGVCYWPQEGVLPELLEAVVGRSYVGVDPEHQRLEVFFGTDRNIDWTMSPDSSFAGNRRYVGPNGLPALSFETYGLAPEDLDAIAAARAEWKVIELCE